MTQAGDRPDSAEPGLGVGAGNGSAFHIPVMLAEVLESLAPLSGNHILDGTFGAGGYTRALLQAGAQVTALDRDPEAISGGAILKAEFPDRLELHQARFSELLTHTGETGLDGMVLDIGVSSMQIDKAERGFSFMRDGPLDMRMGQSGVSAADVVNRMKTTDMTRVFGFLGEERHAGRIARAIEAARKDNPITTTKQLVRIIENVSPRRAQDKIHPATRVFQALRTYVNDELGELAHALFAAEAALKPGGRLVIVTFHSLEDRIVKRYFQARSGKASGSRHMPMVDEVAAVFETPGKQPIKPSQDECDINPRSRSAKLRVGVRTNAPAGKPDPSILPLPDLAALAAFGG